MTSLCQRHKPVSFSRSAQYCYCLDVVAFKPTKNRALLCDLRGVSPVIFLRFHVQAPVFPLQSHRLSTQRLPRKTRLPITNYRPPSNRYFKEGVPHPPPRCPSCQLARAFGWFGRAGLQGGCHFVWSAGGFYGCFYMKVVCKYNTIGVRFN